VPIYVKKDSGFHQTEVVSRECPHCGAHAQLIPFATPSFDALMKTRPRNVGLVFSCAACGEPRFVRAAIRSFEPDHVELAASLSEVERARERFQYGYLSADIERLLREAFDCYTAGCYTAFALLSRHAVEAALSTHDGNTRRRWHELLREVLAIAEVEGDTARAIEAAVFGDPHTLPAVGADEAAVLIEAVKDLFYQAYVRTAKLQAAMKMRRFFAGENARNVTPLERRRRDSAAKTS
jgi:predicted RNA-binding Zn-ribbon protein involved in translation (DUF1610 family)